MELGSCRHYGGFSRQHARYHPDLPLGVSSQLRLCCAHLWLECFMLISRLFRMMTAGWFFSPLWMGILSLLILRSSVRSLECLYSRSLAARTIRWYYLIWMISETFSMLSLRERSVPLPSGLVPYFPYTACLPRLSSTTSGPLLGAVI
jgi:hypothetical protein